MKKTLLVLAAFLAFAVPTALAVPPAGHGNQGNGNGQGTANTSDQDVKGKSESNAAHQCKAERKSLGVDAFAAKYGTNKNKHNAFGKCVSQHVKKQDTSDDDHGQAEKNAAKVCKAELKSLGVDAFAAKYGTNVNKHNAFGKCVSQHAKAKSKSSSDD